MIIKPLGQEKLVTFFKNALTNSSLGHAYIIEGDSGSGKKTIARYFAAITVCKNGNACGECAACKQSAAEVNPDVTVVSAEGKSSVGVDKIRQLISTVGYKSVHGGYRVFIIEDANLLTPQAQNALLKVIEEPPKKVLFLLLCDRKSHMLKTIVSRTQTLKLSPLSAENLAKIVPSCSDFVLSYCNGNPGRLIEICADEEFKNFRDGVADCVLRLFTDGYNGLNHTADFFEQNKERKSDIFTITLYLLRDVMCLKNSPKTTLINSDKRDVLNSLSKVLSKRACIKVIEVILDAEKGMGKYGNFNLAVMNMLIRCQNTIKKDA